MMVEEVPTTDQGHTVPLSSSTLRLPHGDTSTNDNERDAVDPVLTGGSASAARIHSDRNLGVETQMSMKKSSGNLNKSLTKLYLLGMYIGSPTHQPWDHKNP